MEENIFFPDEFEWKEFEDSFERLLESFKALQDDLFTALGPKPHYLSETSTERVTKVRKSLFFALNDTANILDEISNLLSQTLEIE